MSDLVANLALYRIRTYEVLLRPGCNPRVLLSDLPELPDRAASGIGGGMCQFTNLIRRMVLHSPLDVVEHHHHSGLDLFPDFNRQVPLGGGVLTGLVPRMATMRHEARSHNRPSSASCGVRQPLSTAWQ